MKTFLPPTWLEAHNYAAHLGYTGFDATYWIEYNINRKWMIKDPKNPGHEKHMTNWRNNILAWYQKWKKGEDRKAMETRQESDAESVRRRLLAGEHVNYYEVEKLPAQKRMYLSCDEKGKWYLPKPEPTHA